MDRSQCRGQKPGSLPRRSRGQPWREWNANRPVSARPHWVICRCKPTRCTWRWIFTSPWRQRQLCHRPLVAGSRARRFGAVAGGVCNRPRPAKPPYASSADQVRSLTTQEAGQRSGGRAAALGGVKLLLDSHVLLWASEDCDNKLLVSTASV